MEVNVNEVVSLATEMYLWHANQPNKWRWGQCVFNAAYEMHPSLVNALRASAVDCFHDDALANNFLEALAAEGRGKISLLA